MDELEKQRISEDTYHDLQTTEEAYIRQKKRVLPKEILNMDSRSIELYNKALQDGADKTHNIRLMIVGHYGVGKSTLNKRLFKESLDINERVSTNGIDVGRCKILKNKTWLTRRSQTVGDRKALLHRKAKLMCNENDKLEEKQENLTYEASESDEGIEGIEDEPKKKDTKYKMGINELDTRTDTAAKQDDDSVRKRKHLQELVNEVQHDFFFEDDLQIDLSVWDFAGQNIFYATHQAFLSPKAIYLLVVDVSRHIDETVQDDIWYFDCQGGQECKVREFIEFWLNSIHEFCSLPGGNGPPVILVGTHIDRLKQKSGADRYLYNLRSSLVGKGTNSHLTEKHFYVDNTIEQDETIEQLRQYVVKIASEQSYWGERIPAKWIALEEHLIRLNKEQNVQVLHMKRLLAENRLQPVPIESEAELELFLKFHHESGTILYFGGEDLNQEIVLDPQWLIDAFKSLITSAMFRIRNAKVQKKWQIFDRTAVLTQDLIELIWSQDENKEFLIHKEIILKLMEKLGLVAKPKWCTDMSSKREEYYFVPCKLKDPPPAEVIHWNDSVHMKYTSKLCLTNAKDTDKRFLSLTAFNRFISASINQWPLSIQNGKNMIFCGGAVFQLEYNHYLYIFLYKHVIQIWISRLDSKGQYPSVSLCRKTHNQVKKILDEHFRMRRSLLSLVKCPQSSLYSNKNMVVLNEYNIIRNREDVECFCQDNGHVVSYDDMVKYWLTDDMIARFGQESPGKIQGNDYNQDSENGQPVEQVTKQEQESHGSRENTKTVESSPEGIEQLEQIFSSRKDKLRQRCTHEGRLLRLEPSEMKTVLKCCPQMITGGFGEVFISKDKIPGLDIKVVVKKIEANTKRMNHKLRSMTNEKLASRTMHFAIVPILANFTEKNENTNTCYLLSPYLEKGDLFELIKSDTVAMKKMKSVELNKHTRMKIMYHVSSAVEFLHRSIPELRGPIIHLDVKSKNIVLDQVYNARLTDFGVSREMAEDKKSIETSTTQIPVTGGYYQVGRTGKLEKYFDYYNVGIVIRELLSGLPPISSKYEYLIEMTKKDFIEKAMNMWTTEDVNSFFGLSNKCITDKSISAEYIVTEIEKILRSRGTVKWDRANESLNCEMCIVNPSVEEKLISHEKSCTCPLRVCVSCMRNEYLNPILCHSCGTGATVIDSANWGAILIAGIDKDTVDKDRVNSDKANANADKAQADNEANVDYSQVWLKDIEDIRDVFVSKFPLVIGMRKENVKVMSMIQTSSTLTTGSLVPKIREAFEGLKNSSVHTLFVYFSGHYFKENGFLVGYENEYLKKEDLKKMIESFSGKEITNKTVTSSVRCIVMLDCCAAPGIASASLNLNVNTSVVQLNACRSNEGASTVKDGSIFKKFFFQGLTLKATKETCYIRQLKSEIIDKKDQPPHCSTCPIKGDDFVTIENLHKYICDHLREFSKVNGSSFSEPVIHTNNMKSEDAILGYLIDSDVSMQILLRYEKEGNEVSCEIPHQFNRDMNQLRTLLFSKYMEKLDETLNDFKDICCIGIELGPKTKHKLEVKTIEQLNSAWNAKREIVVSLRDISMIRHGMVGRFIETENVKNHLFKNYDPIEKPNSTVVFLKCEELEEVLKNEDLESSYDEFYQTLEALKVAIKETQKAETTILDHKSGDTFAKEKVSGLLIIFPCTEDGSHRAGFVCFKLVYDGSDVSQDEQRSSGNSVGNDNNLVKSALASQDQKDLSKGTYWYWCSII